MSLPGHCSRVFCFMSLPGYCNRVLNFMSLPGHCSRVFDFMFAGRRVSAFFSPEILQTGAVKGLTQKCVFVYFNYYVYILTTMCSSGGVVGG